MARKLSIAPLSIRSKVKCIQCVFSWTGETARLNGFAGVLVAALAVTAAAAVISET